MNVKAEILLSVSHVTGVSLEQFRESWGKKYSMVGTPCVVKTEGQVKTYELFRSPFHYSNSGYICNFLGREKFLNDIISSTGSLNTHN